MRHWHKLGGGAWYLIVDGTPIALLFPEDFEAFPPIADLTEWKREAIDVIVAWERVFDALGQPGPLGGRKAANALAEVERLSAENARLREALGRYPGTPEGLDDLRCDLHSTIHQWEQTSCDDSAHEDYVDDLVTSIIALLGSAAASLSETGGEG